ncbi:hypothetical protein BGZ73_003417 [Actinomortierella ambigua]|nr:hypothetical protein BGZ73_003417 [Actinomortierella ambigua]
MSEQHLSGDELDDYKEQDRFLPIANVARIMKKALPENAKIAKEAKETVQECVSEFISFITSEASDRCLMEKRKTINGEDILWAMQSLGFENYAEALKIYLSKYREATKIERQAATTKDKEEEEVPKTEDQPQFLQQDGANTGYYLGGENYQGDEDQQISASLGADAPLSPTSVKNYKKNRVRVTSDTEGDANSNEDDDDDEEEEEGAYNASHLHPVLEALDGTTKYQQEKIKSEHEPKQREDDDEDDDAEEEEGGDESPPEPMDSDEQIIAKGLEDLAVEDKEQPQPKISVEGEEDRTKLTVPGGVREEWTSEVIDSRSTDTSSPALSVSEDTQEPARPHITLPCLIETATSPPRTRITLRYVGQPSQSPNPSGAVKSTPTGPDTPASASRGNRVHMVATDLSGESWYATEWAITTMLRSGDELNVVTIVEDDKDPKGNHKGVRAEMREDAEKLTKNIHDQLEHTRLRDITVIIHIIAATKSHGAKDLLIEIIDDIDDLSTVIVGSRGRGAIKGLLLGSISNFLVHNSPVPVMVVRAPKNKGKKKKKGKKGRQVEHTKMVREANKRYDAAFSSDDDR